MIASGYENYLMAIQVDNKGNVYIGESLTNSIQTISVEGSTKVVENGFNIPRGIAFDNEDNMFIINQGDGKIFKIPSGCHNHYLEMMLILYRWRSGIKSISFIFQLFFRHCYWIKRDTLYCFFWDQWYLYISGIFLYFSWNWAFF